MEEFKIFIIIPPGLEDLAVKEIKLKLPPTPFETVKGGIETTVNLEWIENAHLLLKIPTRILLRITEFKVRDFPKLYQKFLNFNWTPYLSHPEPTWEISCSKSRLNHTGRMEETIQKALGEVLKKQPLKQDWIKRNYSPQAFYIRLVDDNLTLSLDLTGEPLYKRGLQTIKGEAPIRENLAAAMVFELTEGLTSEHSLVDPMCGSGTLLTEALTFFEPLHLRPFSFETAPFYKGKILKKKTSSHEPLVKNAFGFDLNSELMSKIKKEVTLPITFEVRDSLVEKLPVPSNSLMICNPPYGERIKIEGKRGSFLKEAWKKFLGDDSPLRFGWILPSDMDDLFTAPKDYKLLSKRHLKNGGMAVTFWVWEKKNLN